MPLGRHVRDFDIAYLEALSSAYPGADADELSKLTYRSPSTVTRWMRGEYDGLRQPAPRPDRTSKGAPAQLSIAYDTGVEQRLNALESRLAHLEAGLGKGTE